MQVITLPEQLTLESNPIQIVDYYSLQEISKRKINLTHNLFSFLNKGTKKIIFDNTSFSIDNSMFLLMKSGHCLTTEILSEIKNYRSILFFFSTDTLLNVLQEIDLNKKKLYSKECKSVYSFKYDEFIHRFVESLLDISKLPLDKQQKLLKIKLEEIILYLVEIYGIEFIYSLTSKNDDSTQKLIQIVEANQLNNLTINELSFLCNMSISTFKRKFIQYYSESPARWFKYKRLEHAFYLLNYKHKKASEIYLKIGYESLSSFIQAYKSKYGATPKQHYKN